MEIDIDATFPCNRGSSGVARSDVKRSFLVKGHRTGVPLKIITKSTPLSTSYARKLGFRLYARLLFALRELTTEHGA